MKKRTKYLVLRTIIILAFGILASRIWYIQVVRGSYYQQQGNTSKTRVQPVQALRGIIYDRHGTQLVWNTPAWDIDIVPHGVPNNGAWAMYRRLSKLLAGKPSAAKIAHIVSANMWQQYAAVTVKGNVSEQTAFAVKQMHAVLPGVRADAVSSRLYATGDPEYSLSHILGYTGIITPSEYSTDRSTYPYDHYLLNDRVGQAGIEEELDNYLHGVNGKELVEVDAGERPVRVLREGHFIPGDSVYLTINWKLQKEVSRDLASALNYLHVPQGVAIMENVHTGEILAMASLPSYNDNWFSNGISYKRYQQLINNPGKPLQDNAIQGQFAPGSIYKVVTASAALQSGKITASTIVDDTGLIDLGPGAKFYGWVAPPGLGPENVVGALAQSSDIYFYTVVGGNPTLPVDPPHIGSAWLAKYARLYGLGQPTGIDLPNESPGFVPTPHWFNSLKPGVLKHPGDSWTIGYDYNSAIGQGFNLVTPLQMVSVASTIANGGTLYRPRIVDKIVGRISASGKTYKHSRVIQPFVPDPIRRNFVSAANLALIREGMHHSVTSDWTGTSHLVYDPRIDAAGKTGTAEVNGKSPNSWWLGFAPYNNPQVAIVVLVPNVAAEGAYAAAPIAHKLLEDYFNLKPTSPYLGPPNGVQLYELPSPGGSQ